MFGDAAHEMKKNPELASRKILNRLARIDGPKNLMDANNSIVRLYRGRPDDWSKERYEAATSCSVKISIVLS